MDHSPPSIVRELIITFERNLESYKSQGYNEANLRQAFINPFFESLGWDMANKAGHAEAYKDVIHEDAIKVGGVTKAPDYCFRIGSARKFFLEAKKPSVSIKDDADPAYQLRRYAWSAKLPLSILTDFEEFAVYDCRTRPNPSDKPATGRIHYLTFKDYLARWDEIASIFSKEAVLKGSFDKYAVSERKRGTAAVDAEFLAEIEKWREALAKHLALRNPRLSVHDLNFAVQRTIDRLIFLRICEDRGVEHYGQLQALLNGQNVYARLLQLYHQADDRYNSGLFHFSHEKGRAETPDDLTPRLKVDDQVVKDIINRLYYPQSPYEFSVFPLEILGQVYEQFLGKVIRLTAGHQAKIEEKPEVKKAGGVYYTPAYIVDYIVKQTVGKLCENRTPKQISKLRILDPACGSGSFLIGAYTCLLDYHRDWYAKNEPDKHRKELFQTVSGDWRLTTQEKKRILLNNIYGVDIDSQAVEVTRLSLLLKVLEGETDQSLRRQLAFIRERALPDLGNNIKCGNSLIPPDYFTDQLLPDEDEMRRINPFDWKSQFPEIMNGGGFEAVIGNPPYVRMEGFKEFKGYLKSKYTSHDERSDLYVYFIEKGHRLLKSSGRFGMIISNKFLRANYGKPLRDFLRCKAAIERIVDFAGLPVFVGATVRTIILITEQKQRTGQPVLYSPPLPASEFPSVAGGSISVEQAAAALSYELEPNSFGESYWSFAKPEQSQLFNKLQSQFTPLAEYCDGKICMGVKSGLSEAFVIDEQTKAAILKRNRKAEKIIKPFLNGRDVRRYCVHEKNVFLIYTYHGVDIDQYPAIEEHLKSFKERLKKRATRQEWYELQQPQYNFARYMDRPKIIFPDISTTPRFALDEEGYYSSNTTYFIPLRDLYLLALLNSRLGCFYFVKTCAGLEGKTDTYLRFFGQYLAGFPVRRLNSHPTEKARHDKIVALVGRMLDLHKRLAAATAPADRKRLQRQIDSTDHEIDQLVYDLYGLTEEEIKIVEQTPVASETAACENSDNEGSASTSEYPRVGHQAPRLAEATRYAGESGGVAPESVTGARDPVNGVREPAGQYGPPPDPPEESAEVGQLSSTRYFETAEGRLSYSEVSERLAVPLVAILDDILQTSPDQIAVTPEWLCLRHKRLVSHLYPDWAGRFRDVNVQVRFLIGIRNRRDCEIW